MSAVPVPGRRRRDRRGRGLRGPLVPGTTGTRELDRAFGMPRPVPLGRTRAERFGDLVLDAVETLEERWSEQLESVEFAVEDVPPAGDGEPGGGAGSADGTDGEWPDEPVPLARLHPAAGSGRDARPPRVVLYRRPIEARALDEADKADLVLDVVVHEVARLLSLSPEIIDPEGHGEGDWD